MRRPQKPASEIFAIVEASNVPPEYDVGVVAIRGYLLDSIGKRGKNELGYNDDAHFIYRRSTQEVWRYFGNTDPTRRRAGRGFGRKKGMAHLKKGHHLYTPGIHKDHWAFRQAEVVTVLRDAIGGGAYEDRGWFGINWHRAWGWLTKWYGTSSLGCQTNPKAIFDELKGTLYELLDRSTNPRGYSDRPYKGQKTPLFVYTLCEETDLRAGKLDPSGRWT